MRRKQARIGLAQAASSALAQAGPPPERQFLRTASSAFSGSRKGRLRKASLICIKSCRLRGAAQLWPGSFGGTVCKKSPASLAVCRAFLRAPGAKSGSGNRRFSASTRLSGRCFKKTERDGGSRPSALSCAGPPKAGFFIIVRRLRHSLARRAARSCGRSAQFST